MLNLFISILSRPIKKLSDGSKRFKILSAPHLFKNFAFNFPYILFTILSFYGLVFGSNNGRTTLSINTSRNQTLITIDPQTHLDYGLAYPLTYELDIPPNSDNLRAYRKFISEEPWYLI